MPKDHATGPGAGDGKRKTTTPKGKKIIEEQPIELTEEQLLNIQSVQFQSACVKNIISCHSGSILSEPEPYIELVDTIERKAKEVFHKYDQEHSESTGIISKSYLNEMLLEMGYTIQHDYRNQIIEKFSSSFNEIDERKWLDFLEKYQAPSYYYGQRLRQYCGRGQIHDIIEIICRGCDVNTGDGEGLTSLHYAAEANHPDVIQLLYDLGGNSLALNAQDKYGWTPLHCACYFGNIDCMKLLIKLGANVTITEKVGKTPLHFAVAQARNGICDYLLAHGANVNTPDHHGMTPLHEAAYKQHDKTYQLLSMVKGCDLNAVDCFGYTPEKHLQLNSTPAT